MSVRGGVGARECSGWRKSSVR